MARPIETFQFPFNSSCTPYNQADFSPEVTQLCHDENELLQTGPGSPSSPTAAAASSSSHRPTSTNPFSLATSAAAVKNRMRVAKCIVVGDISVGKTTLINRYVNDVYSSDYKATIGVDFEVQKFDILGRPFTLQIWDTAGQSRFRDITRIYYKGAHAVIICFDLSNFQSFLNVKFWLNEVLDISGGTSTSQPMVADSDRPFIFLIGTKKDMISNRDQEDRLQKEAKELADQIQAEFWMVSSANGDNVLELFHRVACLTFNRYMSNVAELARLELENTASQSVFYTAEGHRNGTAKVQLPDTKKKSKSKKNSRSEVHESPDQNGNAKTKSRPSSGQSNRKAIARMIHVPQEMIIKFVSNISEQMQSVLKLRKKKKKRTNKVGEMTTASTPDSGVSDLTSTKEGSFKLKPKKKSFQCFGYRCTFSVEQ